MSPGTIILLNGTSSSGKTTLAHALQARLEQPYYHVASDTFNQMAPRTHRAADFWGITNKSASAMHHTVALLSDLGLGVIVDHVILDIPEAANWLYECVQLWHGRPVLFVLVDCPPDELERREQQRGDRRKGQARSQYDRIYRNDIYDMTVDTYRHTTDECADMIIGSMTHPERWTAFPTLYRSLPADTHEHRGI